MSFIILHNFTCRKRAKSNPCIITEAVKHFSSAWLAIMFNTAKCFVNRNLWRSSEHEHKYGNVWKQLPICTKLSLILDLLLHRKWQCKSVTSNISGSTIHIQDSGWNNMHNHSVNLFPFEAKIKSFLSGGQWKFCLLSPKWMRCELTTLNALLHMDISHACKWHVIQNSSYANFLSNISSEISNCWHIKQAVYVLFIIHFS